MDFLTSTYFEKLVKPEITFKEARILYAFCCGATLNRFEAAKLHDSTLNSTVSTLRNRQGVLIKSKPEIVKNFLGRPTRVKRYSLEMEQDNLRACFVLLRRWGYRLPKQEGAGVFDV